MHNKALVRMQTKLRFVCTAQLGRSERPLSLLAYVRKGHLAAGQPENLNGSKPA